jgi:hypothetical protein
VPFPSSIERNSALAGISVIGPRTAAFAVGMRVAEQRLWKLLRYEGGQSYSIQSFYMPLEAGRVHAGLMADCPPAHAGDVADGLVSVLRELADPGPTADELALDLARSTTGLADPNSVVGILDWSATRELVGAPVQTFPEAHEELRGTTAATTADAIAEALPTALLIVPEHTRIPDGFGAYPMWSDASVSGGRIVGGRAGSDERIQLAPEGVTVLVGAGKVSTVSYRDCRMAMWAPDGTLTLFGVDGMVVEINPRRFDGGTSVVREVLRSIPPGLVVPAYPSGPAHSSPPLMRIGAPAVWLDA